MDSSAASAYVYAKASGMLATSFVGNRASKLFSMRSLRELYGFLFPNETPSLPESLLAKEIESLSEKRFIEEYLTLLESYSKPAKILVSLLHYYDYNNVKEIGAALSLGETARPDISDIKRHSMMNYAAWPVLRKITEHSTISWYTEAVDISEQYKIDSKIDEAYISELWSAVKELSGDERAEAERIVAAEFSFRNVLWALRLKVYYKMPADEIFERLAFADTSRPKADVFARRAVEILGKDCENWDDWKDWRYASHLNPHEDGVVWEIDPSWVGKSVKREVDRMYAGAFHRNPLSVLSLVSWFKMKQNELDCIRTVAEGLRLDVPSEKLRDVAGIPADRPAN